MRSETVGTVLNCLKPAEPKLRQGRTVPNCLTVAETGLRQKGTVPAVALPRPNKDNKIFLHSLH